MTEQKANEFMTDQEETIAAFCMFCNTYAENWKYGVCEKCRQGAVITENYRIYSPEHNKIMISPQEHDFSGLKLE